jgi:hypothetical protein
MRPYLLAIALGAGLCWTAAAQSQNAQGQQRLQPLKLVQKIQLPEVKGRIDHISVDVKGKRLFLAALGNGTMEVIDLAAGKPLHSITGFKDAQAALFVPESNLIFVSDGELGVCNIYDGATYKLVRSINDVPGADNIRYDAFSARTYGAGLVHVAYRKGLRALDSRDGSPVFDIPLDAQSESFQFEARTGRIFANLPTLGYVAVASSGKRVVLDKWPLPGFKPFYPMALDAANHRLFIGSRNPAMLVVLDTESGKIVTSVEGVGHTDDLWFDAAHKRLYMSGGNGEIGVFEQRDADHYALTAKIASVPGASTSFFAPEFNRLYVPATPYAGQPSAVQVFEVQP